MTFGHRMWRIKRDYTLHQSPSTIMWERGFFLGDHLDGCRLFKDQVIYGTQCVVKFEVNSDEAIRAVFLGDAGPITDAGALTPVQAAYRSDSGLTSFFDYDHRRQLASIVAERLKAVL